MADEYDIAVFVVVVAAATLLVIIGSILQSAATLGPLLGIFLFLVGGFLYLMVGYALFWGTISDRIYAFKHPKDIPRSEPWEAKAD